MSEPIRMSRDEIVALLERIAQDRRKATASQLLRAYRDGTLDEPGDLMDFLSLADLLSDHDPVYAG